MLQLVWVSSTSKRTARGWGGRKGPGLGHLRAGWFQAKHLPSLSLGLSPANQQQPSCSTGQIPKSLGRPSKTTMESGLWPAVSNIAAGELHVGTAPRRTQCSACSTEGTQSWGAGTWGTLRWHLNIPLHLQPVSFCLK